MLHNSKEEEHKVDKLTDYELEMLKNQRHGLKDASHLTLMKKTEYEAFITTGRSPNYKPNPRNKKMHLVLGTKFQLAEDEEGKEFVLIGDEYIPIELIKKHKDYKEPKK